MFASSLFVVLGCTATFGPNPLPGALYYKLNAGDVGGKLWPESFLKYSVLVADPGLTAAMIATIRKDLPGRKIVAYTW